MSIPTYVQASRKRLDGDANPLDVFITNHEPGVQEVDAVCREWREQLENAIEWKQNEAMCSSDLFIKLAVMESRFWSTLFWMQTAVVTVSLLIYFFCF